MKRHIFVAMTSVAFVAFAGEWHSGNNNLCSDCHTMHFSMTHDFNGASPVPTTPAPGGNWLGATGPNNFLLKLPANQLCLACHDGQNFAPDVMGANFNASPTQGRSAGALNDVAGAAPYQTFKGHTLGSTTPPPGFNPAAVGAPATWYDPAGGLECINCHAQHGPTNSYRNLGPYSLGANAALLRPTYTIGTTNVPTTDVWINIAGQTGTVGSRTAGEFNDFYDHANVTFNKNSVNADTTTSSNRMDNFCGGCHGNFHGGPADSTISNAQTIAGLDAFIRHPTSVIVLGASGAAGYGGHSSLSRYVANTYKTRVYASDRTAWTDASPGCVSCHKAHGNQNPFGLFFLKGGTGAAAATGVDEQGGYAATQTVDLKTGYRNLCGQCHSQGN